MLFSAPLALPRLAGIKTAADIFADFQLLLLVFVSVCVSCLFLWYCCGERQASASYVLLL